MSHTAIEAETKYWVILPGIVIVALCSAILFSGSYGPIGLIYLVFLAVASVALIVCGSVLLYWLRRHRRFPLTVYSRSIHRCGIGILWTSMATLMVSFGVYCVGVIETGVLTFRGWYLPVVICCSCIQNYHVFSLSRQYRVES